MTGGFIIEVVETETSGKPAKRLWCVDRDGNESLVFAERYHPAYGPGIGDAVWWRGGWIYCGDYRIPKVGVSYKLKPA